MKKLLQAPLLASRPSSLRRPLLLAIAVLLPRSAALADAAEPAAPPPALSPAGASGPPASPSSDPGAPRPGPDAYRFGEVIVVTGQSKGVEATGAVATVTAEQIEAKGARTLDQALNLLPGVNVRVGGEGIPRIDIRGFRTRHVLLLLDGVPINSAVDAQFDPTLIPTENVATIKLTEGASSVLYGQGGLGGVINIVSKAGTGGLRGVVSGEAGDHAPYLGRASVSGGKGPVAFFLSGSSTRSNSFPLSSSFQPTDRQPAGYRYNSDRKRSNVLGNVAYTPASELGLGLTVSYVHAEFGKPTSAIDNPFDPFASAPRFDRVPDTDQFSVQASADYQATERLRLRGWGYVNHLDEQDDRYDNASFSSFDASGSFRQRVDATVAGASLQPKYDLGAAGVVGVLLSAERDSWANTGFTSVGPGVPPATVDSRNALYLYSAAVEYELSPVKGLGLVAGYGHHWQSRSGGRSADDFALLGAAYYDLLPATRLKASFSRNVRFPSLSDLYDPAQGNPGLVAERAYTASAGVEQRLRRESIVSLNVFTTEAKNLIQTDQATGLATNLADVRFAGFELAGASRPVKALTLRASCAFLHSEDRSRAGRQEQQYTPGNKVAAEAAYRFPFGLEPYLSVAYVGDQYYYTRNAITPVQKGKLADYALVNVRVSQRLLRDRLTLYVGGTNVFDVHYETSYGFPQAGRFVYGGVEVRL